MKIHTSSPFTSARLIVLGGLSLTLLNAMSPVELLSMQSFGQPSGRVQKAIAQSTAQSEDDINVRVYQAASPAVVTIDTDSGTGSGVIVSADGLILTNAHVVDGADTVKVFLPDRQEYEGRVVGYGANGVDLAAVRIQAQNLPTVAISTAPVQVGQRAFAIGNPFGRFDGTFTTGIVSRLDANRGLIQTDAAINPGNSGGALLNSRGELIGINTSIFTPQRSAPGTAGDQPGNIGIGFAIAINPINDFLTAVRNGTAPTVAQQSSFLAGSNRPAQQITLNGVPIQGQLTRDSATLPADDSYYDAYSFEGSKGQQVVVEMNSANLDAYLILLSPQGRDLAQDDDGGGATNARLAFTLPEDGTYTVLANSYASRQTGSYDLRLAEDRGSNFNANRQPASPVSGQSSTEQPSTEQSSTEQSRSGQSVSEQSATVSSLPIRAEGVLGPNSKTLEVDGSRYEEFLFEGSRGQQVTISLNSRDFDPYVMLVGPDDSVVAYNDDVATDDLNAGLTVTLPSSGVYRVLANALDSSGAGRFRLTVNAL